MDDVLGTAATVTAAILGGAHIVRVHDGAEIARAALVAGAIAGASAFARRSNSR